MPTPPLPAVLLALVTLYTVWGSTYLAIHWVVEDHLPLLSTAAVRFAVAGALMTGVARARGAAPAPWARIGNAAVAGTFLFVVSNALVMYAQTRIASGLTALLVALTPVWIALFDAVSGERPGPVRAVGVVAGLLGVGVLVDPTGGTLDPIGAGAVIAASLAWSTGTVWLRFRPLPEDLWASAGWQMGTASVSLAALGWWRGEAWPDTVSPRGAGAFAWLLFGGSVVGFGTYTWLLKVTRPAIATTYAYVNPLVAVLLGWWFASEPLTARAGVAAALILGGVAAISLDRRDRTTTGPKTLERTTS